MKKTEVISSRQNQKIKNILELQKYSERVRQELFVIEGIREIEKAVSADYGIEAVFFAPGLIGEDKLTEIFRDRIPHQIYQVSDDVYAKIAYRENSGGLVVLAKPAHHRLDILSGKITKTPLILVIEGVEKPGNLGAIYRTADAAGIDGIVLCDTATDIYNPNAIRASLGCVFTVPTAVTTSTEAIRWLRSAEIRIFSTYLQKAVPYYSIDFKLPSAIVMGTESSGITREWLHASDANIIIPMYGITDSMNVSTSAAVIIFEACRQRKSF